MALAAGFHSMGSPTASSRMPPASTSQLLPGPESEAKLEDELQRQCAELECQLRQDPLYFENEALEVQLVQMQDDYMSLQEDFRSAREYFGQQLADKAVQLEEQSRSAGTAEGKADSLRDVLHFHEDQGQLAGSYWRAQFEKREDSIRFLTLKLQEYTVSSTEYRARRMAAAQDADGMSPEQTAEPATPSSPSSPSSSRPPQGGETPVLPSAEKAYKALLDQHLELCRQFQEREADTIALERELESCELCCAALRAARDAWASDRGRGWLTAWGLSSFSGNAQDGDSTTVGTEAERSGEAERIRLRAEVEACEQALAATSAAREQLPPWAHRCTWRDELDVRAGQLERISLQFDATKRSLDAANEELQWQATNAEALRMRLSDVIRSAKSEEAKAGELRAEHRQSEGAVQELIEHWRRSSGPEPLPQVFQQAQWLLDSIRRGGIEVPGGAASPLCAGTVVKLSTGCGFIKPDSGEENVLFMPTACGAFGQMPAVGTRVLYAIVNDTKSGRRAEALQLEPMNQGVVGSLPGSGRVLGAALPTSPIGTRVVDMGGAEFVSSNRGSGYPEHPPSFRGAH